MITYKILFLGTLKANINPQEIPIAPQTPISVKGNILRTTVHCLFNT
nr:MAG TPA: hypothetical protein [Caudoviricetes sp.]